MSRSTNLLRGGLSGAQTGAAIGSFIPGGTFIGAGIGGLVGAGIGAFSKSDEEIRSGRIRDLITKYSQMKAQEQADLQAQTQKNVGKVGQFATGQKAQANAGIARRSASQGITGGNEASILSAENQIGTQASNTLQNVLAEGDRAKLAIDSKYNGLIAGANYDEASAPIQPNGVDVLETLAGPAMQFAQNKDFINAIKGQTQTPDTLKSLSSEDVSIPEQKFDVGLPPVVDTQTSLSPEKPTFNFMENSDYSVGANKNLFSNKPNNRSSLNILGRPTNKGRNYTQDYFSSYALR